MLHGFIHWSVLLLISVYTTITDSTGLWKEDVSNFLTKKYEIPFTKFLLEEKRMRFCSKETKIKFV